MHKNGVSTNRTLNKSSWSQQHFLAFPQPARWPAVPGRARDDEPLLPDCGAGKGENTLCAAASCPVVPPAFLFLYHPFLLKWESSGKGKRPLQLPEKKQMPPELSHFRHSHVYLTVGGNYSYSYTCHKPVRTQSCAERTAWVWLTQESSSGAFCKYPRWPFLLELPPSEVPWRRPEGSRTAPWEQQPRQPRLRANLHTRLMVLAELLGWGEVPAAISLSSACTRPCCESFIMRAKVRELWRCGTPAFCLPLADKSHLSHPFLPNTEQYLAQGSYLNVDLTAQSKNRLVFL